MSTNNLSWNQSLLALASNKKPSQSILKLFDGEIKTILDLVYIFPLRIQQAPKLKPFTELRDKELFLGRGKVLNVQFNPAHGRKGKGKVQLYNATCVVKDSLSEKILNLKWFNTYPSLKKQLEALEEFNFMGTPSDFRGVTQIINPQINPKEVLATNSLLIEYPTVNTVPGNRIKALIEKIPGQLWEIEPNSSLQKFIQDPTKLTIHEAFKTLHGKSAYAPNVVKQAKERLIYDEFLLNQLKILARKLKNKSSNAPIIEISIEDRNQYTSLFPYSLTEDQIKVLDQISTDLASGHPMMRMIQGDVGCGKTTLAILASLAIQKNNAQTAFMCPTEALAIQHAETLKSLPGDQLRTELLLGSTKASTKKEIYDRLKQGSIDLIIGTHSLIQDAVEFKNLQLAIIDEQHKFGVAQRQKLLTKGEGVHSIIMTATPIPRTLQLAQYGDLDISTIKTIPKGRKGTKTRIVTPDTYEKYLSFIKTRVSLGEQVYIVAPAIEESEVLNLKNVKEIYNIYKSFYPNLRIEMLHGQLSPDEKQEVLKEYTKGNINILISTTVIEVGINVLNSTVISIYNPDRFGLSSLHQLRGRVGRGEKPGFCFLITDESTSKEALKRIKIIEKTNDGFEIAEADLKNRGQGDLFGPSQSGYISSNRIGNIFDNFDIFDQVSRDLDVLKETKTELINNFLFELSKDTKVSSTI